MGEALEGGGRRSGRALADLAHHFAAAAPFGPPERAVEYNVRAARAATAALAFDEAAAHLRTAIELAGDAAAGATARAGRGRATAAGHALEALEAFRAAAAIGRERGDRRAAGRAPRSATRRRAGART